MPSGKHAARRQHQHFHHFVHDVWQGDIYNLLRNSFFGRRTRVSRQNKLTRPVHIVAHPFDTWVTGPLVDRATRLETIGHVELAIQVNAAARPRGGP